MTDTVEKKAGGFIKGAWRFLTNKWVLMGAGGLAVASLIVAPLAVAATIKTAAATGGLSAPFKIAAAPYTAGLPELVSTITGAAGSTAGAALPPPPVIDPTPW